MFTGIVEEKGIIKHFALNGSSGRISIKAKKVLEGTQIGDSIAVNGVCLTVVTLQPDGFEADVMRETVERSSLSAVKGGDSVNLERAMALGERFGGHIVTGHIDGIGSIVSQEKDENAIRIRIESIPSIIKGIVMKGSIAIDGISLTVSNLYENAFEVSVIPHTCEETTLAKKKLGDIVNLEKDVIGKYVERMLSPYVSDDKEDSNNLTYEKLLENGF